MTKIDRYSNNYKDLGLKPEAREKLKQAKVVVMGAGSLGSSVIMNLCALGIEHIKIIDSEIVNAVDLNCELIHKPKNVSRAKVISAKDWIQEFNDDVKVELDKIELNELNYFNVISNYDIIIDCFNNSEAKYMLNEIAIRHNKILIHGATQGFYGQVTTIIPKETGCLNCIMPKPMVLQKENYAEISSVISIISGLMAQEALKIITNTGTPLMNRIIIYDGIKGEFKMVNYVKIITCDVCQDKTNKELQPVS